jgi:hypothetical protein
LPALAVHRLIDDAERKLGISAVTPEAQRAWLHWRREFFDGPGAALRFCEELLQRQTTFAALQDAARESRCGNPHTALKYLDFVLARQQYEQEPKNPF